MTTTSYPVVGDNVDHAQWRSLESGVDGLIDTDASTADRERLGLDLSDLGTTAHIKRGRVRVKGFVLQVTAAHDLTLAAAVGSPVVYSVGVMYDPALESNAAGPLYLNAQVKSSQVIPSGGAYRPLYEVTRNPSQVLSQAAVLDLRRYVGPSLVLADNFPLTGYDFPAGTQAWRAGELMVRRPNSAGTAMEWVRTGTPTWTAIALPSSVAAAGTAPAVSKVNGLSVMRGAWRKADNSDFAVGGGTGGAYSLGTLPVGYRPGVAVSFTVDHGFDATATSARVVIQPSGVITGQVGPAYNATITGATSAIRADGVIFPAEG